jgi:hypothetical protein
MFDVQSNHRSWADFYLDVVATDGNAQMLSRMAVALVFPMFMGAVCVIKSVILFQRGRKHDKEARVPLPAAPAQSTLITWQWQLLLPEVQCQLAPRSKPPCKAVFGQQLIPTAGLLIKGM